MLRFVIMTLILAWGVMPLKGQTNEELRAIYQRQDIGRMEEIARAGNVKAQTWMGLMLQNRRRPEDAEKWYRRAVEAGDPFALAQLGSMLIHSRRYEEAAQLYRVGAERGDSDAQATYASLLLQGEGLDKKEQAAAHWYRAAARQGNRYAYYPLARLLAEGIGVERNIVDAFTYVLLAEHSLTDSDDAGRKNVSRLKDHLRNELAPGQIRQATLQAQSIDPSLNKALRLAERLDAIVIAAAAGCLGLLCWAVVRLVRLRRRFEKAEQQTSDRSPFGQLMTVLQAIGVCLFGSVSVLAAGAALGALSAAASLTVIHVLLPSNAMATTIRVTLALGALGFIAGAGTAGYQWLRWSHRLFAGTPSSHAA